MVSLKVQISDFNPHSIMATLIFGSNKISGYGRFEEEALVNAYRNFFDAIIDNEELCAHLSSAIMRVKEGSSGQGRRPPRDKNDIMLTQNSGLNDSYDRNEKNNVSRILQTSVDLNKSRHNTSVNLNGSYMEGDKRENSKSKLRQILGRSFHDYGGEMNSINKTNNHGTSFISKDHNSSFKKSKRNSASSKHMRGDKSDYYNNNERRSRHGSSHHHRGGRSRSGSNARMRFINEPHDCIYR